MPTQNHQNPPPFSIVNCTLLIVNWNSTFSAKEKDSETNLSVTSLRSVSSLRLGNLRTSSHCTRSLRRFGSRYYNSNLSIWLSVDPKASKHPHLSNYIYCSNNPVRLIDPNGEDEYEFDECGYYLRTITNTNADIIHIVNGDGERVASSKKFAYGSIISPPENGAPSNNTMISDATLLVLSDEEAAGGIFEFFSNSTSVEWCSVSAESQNGDCEYYIGTNHDNDKNNIASIITKFGLKVERSAHNHPNNSKSVSKADHKGAILYEKLNPNVQLYNYTIENGYTRYSSKSIYEDENGVFQIHPFYLSY